MSSRVHRHGTKSRGKIWEKIDAVKTQLLNRNVYTYMGYYTNTFARESAHGIEKLTRPLPQSSGLSEIGSRLKSAVMTVISIPLAAVFFLPAVAFYITAAYVGKGRFERIELTTPRSLQQNSIKVMALNACFQDPWSPLTGGVIPPFEPVGDCTSRVAAVVRAITEEDPTLFLGQEFDHLGTQDECIHLMKQKGYQYFLRDLGSSEPISNPSGLFVASKVPLENIHFVPFPTQDRAGLAKWAAQGALTFTVSMQGKVLRFVNAHLNYGNRKSDHFATVATLRLT